MSLLDRTSIAAHLVARLVQAGAELRRQWRRDAIPNLQIDDLLPDETAAALFAAFPAPEQLPSKRSLAESRHRSSELAGRAPLLREAAAALQDPRVIAEIAHLTDTPFVLLEPQPSATGIMQMQRGDFVNPHLDLGFQPQRGQRRVLSVTYYVTPDRRLADGGHLELWHAGPEGEPTTILSKWNRLSIVAIDEHAWHSISPVSTKRRCCGLFSYYHARVAARPGNDSIVTAYRGRPEQKLRDLLLRADTFARQSLYRFVIDGQTAPADERARPEQPDPTAPLAAAGRVAPAARPAQPVRPISAANDNGQPFDSGRTGPTTMLPPPLPSSVSVNAPLAKPDAIASKPARVTQAVE
jgi:Rps23 Pro-64 3,4-dihydroxylase Tpa1-like proline 4-hydroxylase